MKKNLCLLIVMGGLCSNCYSQEIIMGNYTVQNDRSQTPMSGYAVQNDRSQTPMSNCAVQNVKLLRNIPEGTLIIQQGTTMHITGDPMYETILMEQGSTIICDFSCYENITKFYFETPVGIGFTVSREQFRKINKDENQVRISVNSDTLLTIKSDKAQQSLEWSKQ
ncbi:hypothetical protein FACS1894113_5560 [Alphaproteobacteria bacterium]|nr:hypothetical protein FACS1894113_5560 [Alphaproteobacteria bacterium]